MRPMPILFWETRDDIVQVFLIHRLEFLDRTKFSVISTSFSCLVKTLSVSDTPSLPTCLRSNDCNAITIVSNTEHVCKVGRYNLVAIVSLESNLSFNQR